MWQAGTGSSGDRTADSLVLDSWRHRQVTNVNGSFESAPLGLGAGSVRGLGTTDALGGSMTSLESHMDRNRSLSPMANRGGTDVAMRGLGGMSNARVGLADLHLSQGNSYGLNLDGHPNAVLQTHQSIAEMSMRRRDAVKAAFSRIDQRGMGSVSMQDLQAGLQRYSNLSSIDQQRVAHGIGGNSSQRISFVQFLAYYQLLGNSIERDRDFEDLIRHHWGFSEVCDILDDMKNKFMMVGLAYTFRHGLNKGGGCQELSMESFRDAISQVGMSYNTGDLKRVFDAFDSPGGTLEVLKLTQHLTSAPKPPTPLPALYGTAHISEVNSEKITPNSSYSHLPGFSGLHGGHALGYPLGKVPEPAPAPPETKEQEEPPPQAPPEEEEDGVHAPFEAGHGNPNEPPPEAPPEDDEESHAPPENHKKYGHDDPDHAPPEGSIPRRGGGNSNLGQHSSLSPMGKYSGGGHLAAAAMAGNRHPAGKKKGVTVGINYIGTPNELSGCINDSDSFVKLLTDEFGYKVSDIRQLRDDHPQRLPTRKNITAALNWLVNGARAGDHLFFHYSGHGSQQTDTNHDEMDGKDETLVPCDFQRHGMLSDDELRKLLVLPLPDGVRLTVILDCCHSGTALDLPYKTKIDESGNATMKKKDAFRMPPIRSTAEVVMVSGCMDTQTSADIGAGMAGNSKNAGAMTTAFMNVIRRHPVIDYFDIIVEMRKFMRSKGFKQVPQLSSETSLNLSDCFMPEVQPKYEEPSPPLRQPVRKALTIGINYLTLWPGKGRLSGCINDSETMVGILKETYGFMESQIQRLRDDRANMMPTKANILAHLKWLTDGAGTGDELFFHYSGHGGQQEDKKGDERDGKDETLIPCDFQTAGQITDDELHELLVDSLPKGVRLWVILDCCHSGTALDLAYKVQIGADGSCSCKKFPDAVPAARRSSGKPPSQAEVILLSGCKDSQTSADIGSGQLGQAKAAGAMTSAFRHTITPTITCEELLTRMRQYLKRNNFEQVPQMSSDQFVQMDVPFVHYQAKKRNKRALPPSLATRALTPTSPVPSSAHTMGHSSSMPMLRSPQEAAMDSRLNRLEEEIQLLRYQNNSPLHSSSPSPADMTGLLPPGLPDLQQLSPQRFPPPVSPQGQWSFHQGQH